MSLIVRVLTPTRSICATTADEVILPGLTGKIGVLEGHASLVSSLDTGLLRIKVEEIWTAFIVCGGIVEVDRNRVTVLANSTEEINTLDLKEASKAVAEATLELEMAEDSKTRLDASIKLKLKVADLEAARCFS